MKPTPRIRLIQSWQTYSKGAFLWPSTMDRNWLIATGRAVLDPELAAVTVSPPVTIAKARTRKGDVCPSPK